MFLSKKIIKKINFSFLVSVVSIGFVVLSPVYGESTTDLRDQINDMEGQKIALMSEIAAFDAQINALTTEIARTNEQIAGLTADITAAEAELSKQKEYLAEYLRTIYVEGQVSTVELIAKSKSFSEFVDQSEYLSVMQQNVQETAVRITELKDTLERQKTELLQLQDRQKAMKIGLDQQRAQKNNYLNQLTEEQKQARDKLAKLLSRGTITCSGESPVIKAKNPIFIFPVHCGYVSQGYGMTEFATETNTYNGAIHNGVDVGVGANTGIHPVGNGTVFATGASPSGGWGHWIIIDHDNDYYSLYAHLISPAFFLKGDRVTTSDVIGGVGGTPYWPVHLHFSLFKGIPTGWSDGAVGTYPGNTIDPLDYMDITISTVGTDWAPGFEH